MRRCPECGSYMLITMSDPVWHCLHCRYQEKFKVEK